MVLDSFGDGVKWLHYSCCSMCVVTEDWTYRVHGAALKSWLYTLPLVRGGARYPLLILPCCRRLAPADPMPPWTYPSLLPSDLCRARPSQVNSGDAMVEGCGAAAALATASCAPPPLLVSRSAVGGARATKPYGPRPLAPPCPRRHFKEKRSAGVYCCSAQARARDGLLQREKKSGGSMVIGLPCWY